MPGQTLRTVVCEPFFGALARIGTAAESGLGQQLEGLVKRRGIALCALVLAGGLAWVQLEAANTFTLISGGSGTWGAFPQGVSADASRIYFFTNEALLPGDNDTDRSDVYLRNNGTLSLLSPGSAAADANFVGELADGSALIITNDPMLPADEDSENDIYRNANGVLTLVTTGTDENLTFRRVYGSKVFFETRESLSGSDTDTLLDVYVWSALDSSIALVTTGTPTEDARVPDGLPNTRSDVVGLADGSAIIISTREPISAGDTDIEQDLYRIEGGSATLLTGGIESMFAVFVGASADLSRVFFRTSESLSGIDVDDKSDVYEAVGGNINLLSGATDDLSVEFLDASADGTKVFLRASLVPLAAGGATFATDLYQSSAGAITLVSGTGNAPVLFGGIAADGSRVFFSTDDALTADDLDSFGDVYQWMAGAHTLVSIGGGTTCFTPGACGAFFVASSSDGSKAIFLTFEALLAEDTDFNQRDVYMFSGGVLTLRSPGGGTGGAQGGAIATPELDVVLLLTSDALDLADNDPGAFDIYSSVIDGPPPVDSLAPSVNCAAADGQWHANNVTLACTASDSGSGLADAADASFNLSTSVASGTEDSNASTNSRQVCDVAGNCATAQVGGNKIDRRGPTVQLNTPAAAAIYTVGQVVLASYSCTDNGSGMQSCIGTVANGAAIDTSSAGIKSFGVIGTDAVGNTGTANVSYTVNPDGGGGGGGGTYVFGGFQQPVDPFPTLNTMKAGGAVPVRFSLGGPQGLDIFATGYPRSQSIVCSSSAPEDGIEQITSAGNSSLSYDAATDVYSFTWKTEKAWAGTCRQLVIQFADGSVQRANFKFK